jgi:hypothetical protein
LRSARLEEQAQGRTAEQGDNARVWFSFWRDSGRQKLKLLPNAPLLLPLLSGALG